jgi:repressor of nif and glnA expression
MIEKGKRKQLLILGVLKASDRPLSSSKIGEELSALGHEISERTVRLYLQKMAEDGLTQSTGRRGHQITDRGLSELDSSRIIERVGFLSAKIDQMTYRMDFDLTNRSGTVVINISLVEPRDLAKRVDMINKVFENGYAMGRLLTILEPGERFSHITVPEGMIGIGTVCSVTLNGVLLKYGIPTNSRFGGLLELQDRKPARFVEIITYDGTSIDPLVVFIRSGMTDYVGAVTTGNGRIGASFREFPAESRDLVEELASKLEKVGLGGFMRIGRASQPLLEIPVSEGRVGAIVIGGLNPVAILEETGVRVDSRAMAEMIDYSRLFHYQELEDRVHAYI